MDYHADVHVHRHGHAHHVSEQDADNHDDADPFDDAFPDAIGHLQLDASGDRHVDHDGIRDGDRNPNILTGPHAHIHRDPDLVPNS